MVCCVCCVLLFLVCCIDVWVCEIVIEVVSVGWINVISVINVIRKVIEYGVKIVLENVFKSVVEVW